MEASNQPIIQIDRKKGKVSDARIEDGSAIIRELGLPKFRQAFVSMFGYIVIVAILLLVVVIVVAAVHAGARTTSLVRHFVRATFVVYLMVCLVLRFDFRTLIVGCRWLVVVVVDAVAVALVVAIVAVVVVGNFCCLIQRASIKIKHYHP